MKKIVSALIVAALLVCCMVPAVFAAGTATVSVNEKTAAAGEKVTLAVSISEATFATYGMAVTYDNTVLELVSIDGTGAGLGMFMPNPGNGSVAEMGFADKTFGGQLFTVTFNVKADAKPGKYPVSVAVDNVTMADTSTLTVSVAGGAVIIPIGEHDCDWVETARVDATCSEAGSVTYTCSICGETKTEAIAALGHLWGEWVTVKEAEIGVEGLMERTCERCGEKQEQKIPALKDPNIDPTPGNPGDITMQLTAGVATVVVALFAAVAFVFKRKTAK